jgi:hypothetical protein
MTLPSLADALIVIVLLMPGFITFFLIRRISAIGKELSEFENIISSVIFSIIVLVPFAIFTGLDNIDKIRDGLFQPLNVSILFAVSIAIGIGIGFIYKRFRKNYRLGDPWEVMMKYYTSKKNGAWITVITKDSKEYKGALRHAGISDDSREIVLNRPIQIFRDASGESTSEMEVGQELLFTEDDVARISFFDTFEMV